MPAVRARPVNGVSTRVFAALIGLCTLAGCDNDLKGWVWEVNLVGTEDTPNGPQVYYDETFDYLLQFDGAFTQLAIDNAVFATGTIAGCTIVYQSVVWSEMREDYEVRWKIEGEASYRQTGTGCDLDPGVDWVGTETFEIIYSEHPDIPGGAEYELEASGRYVGEQ